MHACELTFTFSILNTVLLKQSKNKLLCNETFTKHEKKIQLKTLNEFKEEEPRLF